MKGLNIAIYFVLFFNTVFAQDFRDERELYAATKQINQFFKRFNSEEAISGKALYSKDSLFRNEGNRIKYLNILFDNENQALSKSLKEEFIRDVTNKRNPQFLEFHGGNWFAQVSCVFLWNGKNQDVTLFLRLQKEKVGSKWIIDRAYIQPFNSLFNKDTSENKYFLHPLSHELDFMNLNKAFNDNKENIEAYTAREYQPDGLALLLYEVKRGNMKFKTINEVKFHFFQIRNWYFEL